MGRRHLFSLLYLGGSIGFGTAQDAPSGALTSPDASPIRKVITLIQEMKVQVEKEAQDDMDGNEKYQCWCKTNTEQKTAAIEAAEKRIEELNAAIEAAVAKESELKTRIQSLEDDIASDQDALQTATATREKEQAAFADLDTDMKETRRLLAEAIQVLEKVQFLQKNGEDNAKIKSHAREMLIQIQDRVQTKHPKFQGVMQRDLFEVFGSLSDYVDTNAAFLPKRLVSAFAQQPKISEEDAGKAAKPNDLEGAAAGAKSYNSRSGGIVGILGQMLDTFTSDLGDAHKQELIAEINFQNLRAAKTGEIREATQQKENAETELADTANQRVQDIEERTATTEAKEADEEFLRKMTEGCKVEQEQFDARYKVRSDEIRALAETLKILQDDDARDLYAKTMSFVQVKSHSIASDETISKQQRVNRVLDYIIEAAKKGKSMALISLAVRARIDGFDKIKALLDKTLAQLKKQRLEEYDKRERCNKDIDKTEDEIKVLKNTQEDLAAKNTKLSNEIESLKNQMEELKADEADSLRSIKQAGEERKAANKIFQQAVMDQRATANILRKALDRLKQFYKPSEQAQLMQVNAHQQEDEPGRASSPEPAKGQAYEKSGGAGGVVQLLMKIISDAEVEEQELSQGEQREQTQYEEFVQQSAKSVQTNRDSQAEVERVSAEKKSELSETKQAQLANEDSIMTADGTLAAFHGDCDWLLKYFQIRQDALQQEMDAITNAKHILSGAKA